MALPLQVATRPSPLPLPRLKTPNYVIDQLKAAVAADDMVTFRELLAAPQTHANELSCIMKEALARDHAGAASELIRHGRDVSRFDAQAAIAAHAKNCLTVFLDSGWDLNKPLSHATPSVLRYVLGCCYVAGQFSMFRIPGHLIIESPFSDRFSDLPCNHSREMGNRKTDLPAWPCCQILRRCVFKDPNLLQLCRRR